MWCNSLGVEDLYINNLYEDFKDGLALLKIIEKVKPNSVDYKKVEKTPTNKFKKLSNT
jgi:plastin-1